LGAKIFELVRIAFHFLEVYKLVIIRNINVNLPRVQDDLFHL